MVTNLEIHEHWHLHEEAVNFLIYLIALAIFKEMKHCLMRVSHQTIPFKEWMSSLKHFIPLLV